MMVGSSKMPVSASTWMGGLPACFQAGGGLGDVFGGMNVDAYAELFGVGYGRFQKRIITGVRGVGGHDGGDTAVCLVLPFLGKFGRSCQHRFPLAAKRRPA